jgi:hypothetical protein
MSDYDRYRDPDARREYLRLYMREYRKLMAAREGREINPKLGRPRKTEPVMRPAPVIEERPGWPTREQLMAGRA